MSIRLPKAARADARKSPDHSEPLRGRAKPHKRTYAPGGQQPFYTVAGLAARWGMSQRHIRRLIEGGDLRAHRFGKAVRISLADVLVYEASCIAVT
ncbi:MAG: helix-turn-helix domain-containing protein [Novosphingobium sp.]